MDLRQPIPNFCLCRLFEIICPEYKVVAIVKGPESRIKLQCQERKINAERGKIISILVVLSVFDTLRMLIVAMPHFPRGAPTQAGDEETVVIDKPDLTGRIYEHIPMLKVPVSTMSPFQTSNDSSPLRRKLFNLRRPRETSSNKRMQLLASDPFHS